MTQHRVAAADLDEEDADGGELWAAQSELYIYTVGASAEAAAEWDPLRASGGVSVSGGEGEAGAEDPEVVGGGGGAEAGTGGASAVGPVGLAPEAAGEGDGTVSPWDPTGGAPGGRPGLLRRGCLARGIRCDRLIICGRHYCSMCILQVNSTPRQVNLVLVDVANLNCKSKRIEQYGILASTTSIIHHLFLKKNTNF